MLIRKAGNRPGSPRGIGGWRIYEGGGGVKGKIVVGFVLWGGASSPPYPRVGGCERSHTCPSTPMRRMPIQFSMSQSSLIYS
ncbi:MAG TPA: hypothetical protein VFQ24_16575, partial [Terriglobia bacterium]|nr:hypothetical protein [Terriglobia bacterium]